jgi:hypothetical protein
VLDQWDKVIEETEIAAEEYRDQGWDVMVLHPGKVTPLVDETALDVLIPGDEYLYIDDIAEECEFSECHVWGKDEEESRFRSIILKDSTNQQVVCCPLYFTNSFTKAILPTFEKDPPLEIWVRPLLDETKIIFEIKSSINVIIL